MFVTLREGLFTTQCISVSVHGNEKVHELSTTDSHSFTLQLGNIVISMSGVMTYKYNKIHKVTISRLKVVS